MYLAEGRRGEALASYQRHASAHPTEVVGPQRIAGVNLAMNRRQEAVLALAEANRRDPHDASVLSEIG